MRHIIFALIATGLIWGAGIESAAPQTQEKGGQAAKREIIPGSELMTTAEREQYRQRMRGARTPEEQAKVRDEHRKQMQVRARQRGLSLAEPAPQGAQK